MVRPPSFDKNGMKKGEWSPEEDDKLRAYVLKYGHWNWRELPKFAGLARCGKSCRLRWINYLRPGLKRGNFTKEEDLLIVKLHEELGNKWSVIAANLAGRTDNEIKNHWHTHLKKPARKQKSTKTHEETHKSTGSEAKEHQGLVATSSDQSFDFSGFSSADNSDCSSAESFASFCLASPEQSSLDEFAFIHDDRSLFSSDLIHWTTPEDSLMISSSAACQDNKGRFREHYSSSNLENGILDFFRSWDYSNQEIGTHPSELSTGDFWAEPFVEDKLYYDHHQDHYAYYSLPYFIPHEGDTASLSMSWFDQLTEELPV